MARYNQKHELWEKTKVWIVTTYVVLSAVTIIVMGLIIGDVIKIDKGTSAPAQDLISETI